MKEQFIKKSGIIPYLTSPLFTSHSVAHMFTTRHGGRSTGCFSSLNFAQGQGDIRDSKENVDYHHALAAAEIGLTNGDTVRTWQTHTARVLAVGRAECGIPFGEGVDGITTDESGVLLTVRTADCVPILLYDLKNNVCAAVHAGWRGTKDKIIINAIELMKAQYRSEPEDIIAAVGQCARACCYEVGEELYSLFTEDSEEYSRCFERRGGKLFLSVAEVNIIQMHSAGITDEHISDCNICTCCSEDCFSHRRQGIERGSLAAFIRIR